MRVTLLVVVLALVGCAEPEAGPTPAQCLAEARGQVDAAVERLTVAQAALKVTASRAQLSAALAETSSALTALLDAQDSLSACPTR